jgi:hypothetical protein
LGIWKKKKLKTFWCSWYGFQKTFLFCCFWKRKQKKKDTQNTRICFGKKYRINILKVLFHVFRFLEDPSVTNFHINCFFLNICLVRSWLVTKKQNKTTQTNRKNVDTHLSEQQQKRDVVKIVFFPPQVTHLLHCEHNNNYYIYSFQLKPETKGIFQRKNNTKK